MQNKDYSFFLFLWWFCHYVADDRPYKKPKSVKVAFDILDEEAQAGKIDKALLEFAKELYLKEE